ncbi:MAG: hypothetical protein IPO15_10475 [Anaerolineae bacterium]|uniref:hypothetical protein n=1 Tax=Candidatus Amarolinea dominans TaxID=3140696 RepID=UPI003137568D|nr:hypothetical protein [Anaerolineae bacterium]
MPAPVKKNSAVGFDYIPGSTLRGAVAARWVAVHKGLDLAINPAGRAGFLDGTVCYLNAYPEYDGKRTLPTPTSWFTEKDQANDSSAMIHDLAVSPSPDPQRTEAAQRRPVLQAVALRT